MMLASNEASKVENQKVHFCRKSEFLLTEHIGLKGSHFVKSCGIFMNYSVPMHKYFSFAVLQNLCLCLLNCDDMHA